MNKYVKDESTSEILFALVKVFWLFGDALTKTIDNYLFLFECDATVFCFVGYRIQDH